MIEQRLAHEFDAAVAGEPPLGFDPDAVVDEAFRRQRRRRSMLATGGATAAVALVAVTVVGVYGRTSPATVSPGTAPSGTVSVAGPGAASVAVTPSSVATTPGGPSSTVTDAPKSTQTQPGGPAFPGSGPIVAALAVTMPKVLHDHVRNGQFESGDTVSVSALPGHTCVIGAFPVLGSLHRYVTLNVCHDHNALDIAGDPVAGWHNPSMQLISDRPRADGSRVRVYRGSAAEEGDLAVVEFRTDGTVTEADTSYQPEPGQQGFAVDQDMLTALAADPRLVF